MNQIKATEISGDVAVGRNVAIGNDVKVQGDSLIKGHLRVEGWFDAHNIRGCERGMYRTREELEASNPHGHEGWWALVGEGFPAEVYISEEGVWKGTGKMMNGVEIPYDRYEELLKSVEREQEEQASTIDRHEESLREFGGMLGRPNGIPMMDESGKIQKIWIPDEILWESEKGKAEGVAPLNEMGKVPEKHLPDNLLRMEDVGKAEGIAPLNEKGEVPEKHLPDNLVRTEDVGKAEGVAPLNEFAQVPDKNLPVDLLRADEKGKAEGIAPLNEYAQVPDEHLSGDLVRRKDISTIGKVVTRFRQQQWENLCVIPHTPRLTSRPGSIYLDKGIITISNKDNTYDLSKYEFRNMYSGRVLLSECEVVSRGNITLNGGGDTLVVEKGGNAPGEPGCEAFIRLGEHRTMLEKLDCESYIKVEEKDGKIVFEQISGPRRKMSVESDSMLYLNNVKKFIEFDVWNDDIGILMFRKDSHVAVEVWKRCRDSHQQRWWEKNREDRGGRVYKLRHRWFKIGLEKEGSLGQLIRQRSCLIRIGMKRRDKCGHLKSPLVWRYFHCYISGGKVRLRDYRERRRIRTTASEGFERKDGKQAME